MCGIALSMGFDYSRKKEILSKISYRGGDSEGFIDLGNLTLYHSRLSIVDPVSRSNQPMLSACGKYGFVFNGEIYNYRDLYDSHIEELSSDCYFSDTSLFFELILKKGIEYTLSLIDGPFAFIFLDIKKQYCYFGRDHIGEKPLYYRHHKDQLLISSSINDKVFDNSKSINEDAVVSFLNLGYVPQHQCIYKDWQKCSPSKVYGFDGVSISELDKDIRFVSSGDKNIHPLNYAIKNILPNDVSATLAFSGGVDSSIISRVLESKGVDIDLTSVFVDGETNLAEKNDPRLKNSVKFSDDKFFDRYSNLLKYFDEPFSDPAALGYLEIVKIARESGNKVVITGDAADEFTLGYKRHHRLFTFYRYTPLMLKVIVRKLLCQIVPLKNKKLLRALKAICCEEILTYYYKCQSDPALDFYSAAKVVHPNFTVSNERSSLISLERFFYLEANTCPKGDRVGHSLNIETRTPYTSRFFTNYTNQGHKWNHYRFGLGKRGLRNFLSELKKDKHSNSPKVGFDFPIEKYSKEFSFDRVSKSLTILRDIAPYALKWDLLLGDLKSGIFMDKSDGRLLFRLMCLCTWVEINFGEGRICK